MKDVISKLFSRKFWMSVAGVTMGIAMILGATESEITTVAGSVVALGSVISYIIVEGKIDIKRAQNALKSYIEEGNEDVS